MCARDRVSEPRLTYLGNDYFAGVDKLILIPIKCHNIDISILSMFFTLKITILIDLSVDAIQLLTFVYCWAFEKYIFVSSISSQDIFLVIRITRCRKLLYFISKFTLASCGRGQFAVKKVRRRL